MRPFTLTLSAGIPQSIDVRGNGATVYSAPVNDLYIRFDNSQPMPMGQGTSHRLDRDFERIELSSATGQTVTIYAGYGEFTDKRATANVAVTTAISPGASISAGTDVAAPTGVATLISGADPNRLFLMVSNPESSSGPLRVGDSTVSAAKGALIYPGVTLPISTNAAVYVFQNTDPSVNVAFTAVIL